MKKIANLALYLLSGTLLFLACSKDDPDKPTPVEEQNTAPVVKAQTFTVMESATEIGTVDASDEDGDQLTFSITVNDNALFAIDNTGKITLAEGKALDFDTTPSHTITVQVEDKEDKASAQMTINLTDTNDIAPVFEEEGYNFEAFEDIAQDVVMGTISGSDPEGAPVTYKITADENELFAIDGNTGEITLAEGKQLNFEAFEGSEPVHNIVVQISDGELTAEVNVAITVLNIPEAHPDDPAAFVTTWETTVANEKIAIGIDPNYTYDFTVDWGDGTVEQRSISEKSNFIHIYEDSGVHTVAIYGDFPAIKMTGVNVELRAKLKSIEQWGAIQWQSMNSAFRLCTSMVYNVTEANKPNMSLVANMSRMFQDCTLFDGNLNDWNTANVIDMERMFSGASNFNGDLSNWNTEKVTTMQNMFSGAEFFTGQGLETWNTENVINMSQMFYSADNFNGDLSNWNTEKVTNMNTMFAGAYKFQGNLSEWNVLNVTDMQYMFSQAEKFNGNLSGWNIQNVTDIDGMFKNSGMSDENYSATLVGWATLDQGETQIPQGLDFSDQQGMGYCQNIQGVLEARQALLDLNWNIEGDEPVNCPDQ